MDQESHRVAVTEQLGLCESCRELKPVAYTDPLGRGYCPQCFVTLPVPAVTRMVFELMASIPFKIGDRVECRTAGVLFDGVGTVREISIDPERYGTVVHPSFRVEIDEPAYKGAPESCWYMERQLRRVEGRH